MLAKTCGLTQVADSLAELLGQKRQSCFQRLRQWRNEAKAKKGEQRQEVPVAACFAPLLAWILSLWDPTNKQLVLVLDATSVGDLFVVLSISVVVRSCAIPVAWHIQRAGVKGAHKPHWLRLLELLHEAVPADWQVLVMAERGLYAKWLYKRIVQYRWHPFLRINVGCKARPESAKRGSVFEPIMRLVPRKGTQWSGRVWAAWLDRMWLQGRETRRLELAALSQQAARTSGTALVGDGSGDLDHGRGGSPARSTRAAPLPGAGAVEAYCSPQRPSRPAAGRGGGQAVEGQAQTGPELFQSRLQAADASGLAIAREALLLPARRALAASACSACGRRLLGHGIKKPTPKRGVERGGDPCGQYISIKRLSRFVILSASFGSLAGQRSKARAQDDTPASALFDSQTCLIEMY